MTTSGFITAAVRWGTAKPARCRSSGTNADGVPVTGVGHVRRYNEPIAGCCIPAPSVLKFDPEGNLLDAWGGPADPGFLEENCSEEDGVFLARS